MKFLLDMNMPRLLGRLLQAKGHTWRHVGDIGMGKASDSDILEEARLHAETVITHDLDYGHLLFFSGLSTPSVVIVRLRNTHPTNIYTRVITAWSEISPALENGALVIIEDGAVRIRSLPLRQGG